MISIPLTEAKARISGLVERLINLKEPIMITKHGKPVATLIPYEEWEKIEISKAGGLGSVPPPATDHDAAVDAMVDEIYEARTKARARKPAL
ncbi:MAG: type II toxin-antitoxin system Phd/YefM family antitoxin [Candidatus Aminicenantes bacterium]|nr:type II toxin-antitoxin system Phd/YefM family antitoxin [Candidatus Aminicenantes bacterium]